VLKDVIYVFLVWVVVYLSFALGIWLLYKPFQALGDGECNTKYCVEEKLVLDNETMTGVLTKMFWIVFDGDGSDQRIQDRDALNVTEEVSKEFSHPTGLGLWAMYQGIVVILLLNILIAMMNNTYMRIWANVDTEWKYSKSHYQVQQYLAPRAIMPPPFRWFYYFARIVKRVKEMRCIRRCLGRRPSATISRGQNEEEEKKRAYLALMRKLVTMKLQNES